MTPDSLHHLPHGLEYPLRAIRGAQLVAPENQHRRVEALVVQSQAGGHLPGDGSPQHLTGLPIGEPFQSLQDHHRGDHVCWHRRPAAAGWEQVLEQRVREHSLAVLGQEGVHRTRLQKVLAEDGGVEELAIRLGGSLHPPILLDLSRNRESCRIAQRSPGPSPQSR